MTSRRSPLLPLVAVLAACTGHAAPPAQPAPAPAATPITRDLALATFDSAWSRINNSYYDPAFRGIDWEGVRDELRPRVDSARTVQEVRAAIREMLDRIGESHFALLAREDVDALPGGESGEGGPARAADAGLELRWVDGELLVTRVRAEGAAAAAGVGTGWIVEAIGEAEVARWKRALEGAEGEVARAAILQGSIGSAMHLLTGDEGSTVRVRFRDGTGAAREVELVRRAMPGEPVRFGNLPTFFPHLDARRIAAGEGCVGYVEFNVWMTAVSARFDRAVDRLADCEGLVVDLRGNPGGVGGMVMGTAGSFLSEIAPLGIMRTRQGEVRFVAIPRRVDAEGAPRETYRGRLAILVDERSMSTSEVFAAGMQSVGRARVFGTRTPGYALPALMLRLPNQDVLYHAVADLTDPDGRRIEGQGVVPDVPVPLTRADLLAGRDRALEEAVAWASGDP